MLCNDGHVIVRDGQETCVEDGLNGLTINGFNEQLAVLCQQRAGGDHTRQDAEVTADGACTNVLRFASPHDAFAGNNFNFQSHDYLAPVCALISS